MGDNSEIEIYMQKIELFFEKMESEYFYTEPLKDAFIGKVREVAVKNMEENGTPELSKEQLEEIRIEVRYNPIKKECSIHYNNIGIIYLN